MLDSSTIRLLKELSEAKSPSGFEDETLHVARAFAEPFCDIEEDSLRNLYLRRKKDRGTSGKPIFMLDAHGDEVGFMVHSILPNGTLRFVQLGSWSLNTLPGTKVRVRNSRGEWISGVIAAKPPHFLSKEEQARREIQEVNKLLIDLGSCSDRETKEDFGIRIGEPIVADIPFQHDERHGLFHGKAFDCRIGCTALLAVMKEIADLDLEVEVCAVLSSQEEVGERGCKVAVNRINPDIALCFEGCPADDTFGERYAMQTLLRQGPMFRFMDVSVICNPRYQRYALDLAAREGIPVQASVREGGGNNAAIIQSQLKGAPSIVLGVPVRYIHSPNGIASEEDLEASIRLSVRLLQSMKHDLISRF